MLHGSAKARAGQTVLVLGASGGVGSILVQLARQAGVRVVGTASPRHHEALRALGAEPVDYHDTDLASRVRELVPDRVDAVFDHLGGASVDLLYRLFNSTGTLVSYNIASHVDDKSPVLLTFMALLSKLAYWNLLPTGKHASFYHVWTGAGKPGSVNERGSWPAFVRTSRTSSTCSTRASSPRRWPPGFRSPTSPQPWNCPSPPAAPPWAKSSWFREHGRLAAALTKERHHVIHRGRPAPDSPALSRARPRRGGSHQPDRRGDRRHRVGPPSVQHTDDYVNVLGSPFVGEFRGFLISSPLWWLMSIAWIVSGVLIAAASISLARRLTGWRHRTITALGLAQAVAGPAAFALNGTACG